MNLKKSACIETLYTELPLYDRPAAAAADGFAFVEFWGREDKDLDRLKAAAQKAGIGISGFNGDGPFSLIDPAQTNDYLGYLRESVEAAKHLGALSVTIHSNALGEGGVVLNRYEVLSFTVKTCAMFRGLLACAELAEQSGIAMNLEPLNITTDHAGNFLTSSRAATELCDLVGSPMLNILFDVYHMQLNEGSLCDNLTACAHRLGHIHVADAPGRHEPGTGEIRYAKIFAHLEAIGYTGRVGYELFPRASTAEAVAAIMRD